MKLFTTVGYFCRESTVLRNSMGKLLGIFDFDYTIVNENSDIVVRDLLPPNVIKTRLRDYDRSKSWTTYMSDTFKLLFEEGITIEQIEQAISSIPAVPDFVKLFKDLKSLDTEIIILSDSNVFFIDTWLKSRGIREAVRIIYSNPASVSEGGLDIQRFHNQDWCNLCTANLCKGHVLLSHIENGEAGRDLNYKKKFYVGDGHNDLCPSLKLGQGDFVFPRVGFPLLEKLRSAEKNVHATVVPWQNTNDIWRVIQNF